MLASSHSLDRRVDRLVTLNEASRFREQLLFPTTLAVVVVLGLICATAIVVLSRGDAPRTRRVVAFAAVVDLAVLPMSFLARGFPLEDLGAGFYWAFIVVECARGGPALTLLAARLTRPRLALTAVLALVLLVPILDVLTGCAPQPQRRVRLLADRELEPVRDQQLLVRHGCGGGLPARAFLAARWPGRRARAVSIGLLVAVLVVIGAPAFGSDVGGIIAFTPTILVFAVDGDRLPGPAAHGGARCARHRGGGHRLRPRRSGPPRGRAGPPRAPVRAGGGRGASSRCCRSWSARRSPTSA